MKLAAFEENIGIIREYYSIKHQNWKEMDGTFSKWKLWKNCVQESKSCVKQIQEYLDRIARGRLRVIVVYKIYFAEQI